MSNINLEPRKKDGNGFISKVSKTGEIISLKWVEGMHAPKGLGLYKDKLYVADIDEIIVIDTKEGKISKRIPLKTAGMFNDVDVDTDGTVYFSDMDSSKVYRLNNDKIKLWYADSLDRPNGVKVEESRILVSSFGKEDLIAVDKKTKAKTLLGKGIPKPDGIVQLIKDKLYLVSCWDGEIFLVKPGEEAKSLLNTKEAKINTADIGYIDAEKTLLIPTFFNNRLVAYKVKGL